MQKIFYITHAKGGSGASLFATNFAYALAKKHKNNKVLFLDTNQLSDIAILFGIKAKKNILNLDMFLEKQNTNLSNKATKKIFSQTTYKINELDVLLSPEKYHNLGELNNMYKKAIDSALLIYDYIVIDGERGNKNLLQNILPNLQNIFVVTTTDTPSITKTKNFLTALEENTTLLGKISIIYNQTGKFSEKELKNILEFPIASTLPIEINGAWDNILLGIPIIENKKLHYSRKITELVNIIEKS